MADQIPNNKKPGDLGSGSPSSGPIQKPSGRSEEELLKEELAKALGGLKNQSGPSVSGIPEKKPVPPISYPSNVPLASPAGISKTPEPSRPLEPLSSPITSKPSEPQKPSVPPPQPTSPPIPPRPAQPLRTPESPKSPEPPKPPDLSKVSEPVKPVEPLKPLQSSGPSISPSPPIFQKPKEEPVQKPGPEINPLDKKPIIPSLVKETFVPSRPVPPPSAPEREFFREKEFPREREFIPSKKEKEFISKDVETSKEIIRTFQKDLFRREAEVKRENKIPEKEIVGFSPPEPPDEAGTSKMPKLRIPRIPIPKISLKFALIIVGMVLFLSGFYLVYQLKPCIPPFCTGGGGEPTPSPSLPLCDRDDLKNLCQSGKDFPQCDTEKFCSEISVSPCEKTKICEKLVPVETCQPVELIAPVSLLPYLSEEQIKISQKSKAEIISGLESIAISNYSRPYLIRILIEYSPDECNRSWLSLKELFEVFGAKAPENFFTNLKENYTLVYYLPDNEEKSACVAANNVSPFCYGPRLALTFSVNDSSLAQTIMSGWETTFFEDFKSFILGEPKEETMEFKGLTYKDKVQMRFKNVPFSTTALNYGIYKNLLIIGTSKNSLVRTIDFVLKKEEQEREILEGIKTE